MAIISFSSLAILGFVVYLLHSLFSKKRTGQPPLPPGPKPKPLVGNLTDLPPPGKQEWIHWLEHKDIYGPISSVSVFGQILIIFNDADLAVELMGKRGNIHSGRPEMVFSGEMCGWGNCVLSQQNSSLFRAYRKNIGRMLGTQAVAATFHPLQEAETSRFLVRMLEKPEDLEDHLRSAINAITLQIVYGYHVEQQKPDPLIDMLTSAVEQFNKATVMGGWMVDIVPALKYLPDWFPGAGFKETARFYKKTLFEAAETPYAFVKHQIANGSHQSSYSSRLILEEEGKLSTEQDYITKWSAFSLYGGGVETGVGTLSGFFLAAMLYPEVQRKAREEIDRVVGVDRLPNCTDRENLPYINAVVKEVFRWHTTAAMSLPHKADGDDVLDGYFIPKGALLIPNAWAFMHDPKTYRDPMNFNPERFLGENPEQDPREVIFGFGRRICPGRLLGDTTTYLMIAKALAVFDIDRGVEPENCHPSERAEFKHFQQPGMISYPTPFQAIVKPRSLQSEKLIRNVETQFPCKESGGELLKEIYNTKIANG